MHNIKRPAFLRLTALLAALLLLAGCAPRAGLTLPSQAGRTPGDWPDAGSGEQTPDDWDDGWDSWGESDPWQGWAPAQGTTAEQRRYGSAALLAWPSVLVSVYLDEAGGASWDEESIADSRETLAVAVDWIEEQCALYNTSPSITCDDGSEGSGLFYHLTYNGSFAGGTESNESDDFYTAAYDICAGLDTDELHIRTLQIKDHTVERAELTIRSAKPEDEEAAATAAVGTVTEPPAGNNTPESGSGDAGNGSATE